MNRRFQTGDKIGDYRIDGFLGAGGMGEVYLGFHTKLHRRAAVKVLKTAATDANFTNRFFNEARVHSSLHHPSIATLYDFQEINRQLYIFMEYVDGESLEDLIRRRFFTVGTALRAFESVCQAIAFIHRSGIVHRDIKPQNIKFTSAGDIKLLDFGIAKDSSSQRLTQIGGVVGTPSYLAPEQLDDRPASARTDIWSLGVLFYEMLTGVEPFKSESFVTLAMMITLQDFEPAEKVNPAVPPEISRIINKCLRKEPAERYQTVEELLADVRRVLHGEKSAAAAAASPGLGFKKLTAFFSGGAAAAAAPGGGAGASGNFPPDQIAPENFSQESPLRRKLPIAGIAAGSALAVIFLFSLIGLGIWAMSGRQAANNSADSKTPAPANAPAVGANTKANSPVRTQAAGQQQQNPNLRRVRVELSEGRAQVFRAGQLVGTTPFEFEGSEGESVDLVLRREGFEDKEVRLDVTARKPVYTFSLKPRQQ